MPIFLILFIRLYQNSEAIFKVILYDIKTFELLFCCSIGLISFSHVNERNVPNIRDLPLVI